MNLNQTVGIVVLLLWACGNSATEAQTVHADVTQPNSTTLIDSIAANIIVGAERWDQVLAATQGKRVGCVVNHTSMSGNVHLVDRLLSSGVEVVKVFAPEHGFRGTASDGELIKNETDPRTGLPILSLHGNTKRPDRAMYEGLDLIVFDIQDVGTRFYTYISTMHYVMDAGAEYGVPVLILDRPNPNGHYVDGIVLDTAFRSFVGMHPIPSVHGLTVGELAQMINGEGWLSSKRKVELQVIPVENYRMGDEYILPIAPSPNLPNQTSIYMYPLLCHLEGTVLSVGRGTDHPFQQIGYTQWLADTLVTFTPEARSGAKYAKLKGKTCYGWDERQHLLQQLIHRRDDSLLPYALLSILQRNIGATTFIDRADHFDKVAGSDVLRKRLMAGKNLSYEEIAEPIEKFQAMARNYWIYEGAPNRSRREGFKDLRQNR